MTENFITNNDKLEFRQIVLAHIKKILELGSVEFRGGYWQDIGSNPVRSEYVADTRDCYINSILGFTEVLLPYFDKDMTKIYDDYYMIATYPGTAKFRNNKLFVDWIKDVSEKYDNEDSDNEDMEIKKQYTTEFKVFCCRTLFRELNLLLHRKDYLKEAVFGEGEEKEDSEIVEVDK